MLRSQLKIINSINFSLATNILNSRFFHSSDILYTDKDIEDRIKDLALNSPDANLEGIEIPEICLSDAEANKLKETLENLKNLSSSNKGPLDSIPDSELSSFEEAFPNLGQVQMDKDTLEQIAKSLSKISGMDPNELIDLILTEGIFKTINTVSNKLEDVNKRPTTSSGLNQDQSDAIETLEERVTVVENQVESFNNNIVDIMTIKAELDKGLDFSLLALDNFIKNQENVDRLVTGIFLVSPIFAYRGLLKTYSRAIIPKHLPGNLNNSTDYIRIMNERARLISKFNKVAIPSLAVYYVVMHQYYKAFTPLSSILGGKSGINTSAVNMFIFKSSLNTTEKNSEENNIINNNNNNNKFKWFILLFMFILLFIFIIFAIKYLSPSLYDYIINLISIDLYWIKFSYLIWLIGWLIHYILEFYFFIIFSIDSNYFTLPKYLPKFILNWLNRLEENSKLSIEVKHWYIQTYTRVLLFHSSLTLLYIYLVM